MTTTEIAETLGVDLEAVTNELHQCKQTQIWSPHATRSGWTTELEAILEATTADEMAEAVAVARDEAYRLADVKAESLADPFWLAEHIAVDGADSVADVVKIARAAGVTIDDGVAGRWDGLVLDADRAFVFAGVRSWSADDSPYVTLDLLTGDVTHVA